VLFRNSRLKTEMLLVLCNLSLQNHSRISETEGSTGDFFQERLYGKREELHTNSLMPMLGMALHTRSNLLRKNQHNSY